MRKMVLLAGLAMAAVVALGCSGTPTAPQSALASATVLGETAGSASGPSAGMMKTPIAGTMAYVSQEAPERLMTTPSELCHVWDMAVLTYLDGDVEGPVTFLESGHLQCDSSRMAYSGPFEGDVAWNGRSGHMSGQWTTNCKMDPATGPSCDGTMNARGSGGLEGVQFHFKWGPGFFPFPYTGTAFAQ